MSGRSLGILPPSHTMSLVEISSKADCEGIICDLCSGPAHVNMHPTNSMVSGMPLTLRPGFLGFKWSLGSVDMRALPSNCLGGEAWEFSGAPCCATEIRSANPRKT